jgi:predicted aminopeptidase
VSRSKNIKTIVTLVLLGIGGAAYPASPGKRATPELIEDVKDFESDLGFSKTGNFTKHSDKVIAAYRCYYTGKLEIPESYDELRLREGTSSGCPVDSVKYDVFFYPIEAVASGKNPVTSSLENASLERMLMVVPHEDFHEHGRETALPGTFTEAAATLAGFITASEFAKTKFGADSPVAQKLSHEAQLFLQKARIINDYHARARDLYRSMRAGQIGESIALKRKQQLFSQLEAECRAIAPQPSSFDKYAAASNNAGLAFDATYTKYYPLLYDLFVAQGRDARTTIASINQILESKNLSEKDAVARVRDLIAAKQPSALR